MRRTVHTRLPNFVIIGAMKCGTTSLHSYLQEHPEVSVSRRKETNFFVAEKGWRRGLDWYLAQFDGRKPVRGEASPNYTKFPVFAGVAARLKQMIPDARLIYIVREPVARLVSHYMHNVDKGRERRSLAAVFSDCENNDYLDVSRYFMQLEQYLEHFAAEQILVLSLEGLSARPVETLRMVAQHIGADPVHDWSKRTERSFGSSAHHLRPNRLGVWLNRAARPIYYLARLYTPRLVGTPLEKPRPDPELRDALCAVLQKDVTQLRAFAPEALADWPPGWNF
jgi:hypothetical protein